MFTSLPVGSLKPYVNQYLMWISPILVNSKTLKTKITQSDWFMRNAVKLGWLMTGMVVRSVCASTRLLVLCLLVFICLFSWQVFGPCFSAFLFDFICSFCSLIYFLFDTFASLHVCLFVCLFVCFSTFTCFVFVFAWGVFICLFYYNILVACSMLYLLSLFALFAC